VETGGNVPAATARLHGRAAADLGPDELDHDDRDSQISILARAEWRPGSSDRKRSRS
jgi:hypothetical protein